MIKGVNKSIIEINDTGSEYFEKAILFISANHADDSDKKLENKAREYIENAHKPPFIPYFDLKEDRKRKRRLFLILGGYLLVVGAIVLFIVLH